MQKAAPNHAPPASGHPTDEELAAYVDGNLDAAERKRIADHIASCEDCYFVYSETARFLIDSSQKAAAASIEFDEKIVPFPSRDRGLVAKWGAIAALLLIGAGSGTYQFLAPPPGLPTRDMTAALPQSPDVHQGFWLGPTYRGDGGGEEAKPDEAAVRLGVQLVNLQVSLRAGKVTESQDVVARILGLLKSQLFTDDLQKGYTAITVDLANGKSPAMVLPEATRLARESRDAVETTSLDLGQWVEAGRLASIAGNPSFFQQSDSRSFLRRLLWRDRVGLGDFKLDPPTRASLEKISDILSKGDLQAPDYAEIRRETEKILEIHYPEA